MAQTRTFRCSDCGGWNRVDPARAAPRCGRCKAPLPTDGRPVAVSDAQLDELVAKSPVPVVVDFYADWCGPCQALSPILAQLAAKYAGQLVVAKVDTERHQRHASALGVSGIPAVFVYRGGRVVAQAGGLRPLPAWEQLVAPHLG
jgi:thioredoxin 2